jgi:hypothetical protein
VATAGDTFIISGHGQRSPHLWVLLWGPAGSADAFLSVSLTTLRPHSDGTCVVKVGEHPFIKHDTCVMYADTRRITQEKLDLAVAAHRAFSQEPVSPELLSRLRAGLFASAFTPRTFVDMARDIFQA